MDALPVGWVKHPSHDYWMREPRWLARGPSYCLEVHPSSTGYIPVVIDLDIKRSQNELRRMAIFGSDQPKLPMCATLPEACHAAERAYCGAYVGASK